MKFKSSKERPLKHFMLLSWLIPGVLALVASTCIFFFMGWLDYQNQIQRCSEDLQTKSISASRRLSAELLLGNKGSVDPIRELLKRDFDLVSVEISSAPLSCIPGNDASCFHVTSSTLAFSRRIPHISGTAFVILNKSVRPLTSFLNLYLLAWSAIPVFILLVTGLLLQMIFLGRYVLKPISSLVSVAESKQKPPSYWPAELRTIAENLSESFDAREQAVFSMLAKGVIHDFRTWIHSLLTATELVSEQPEKSEKRLTRLETLFKASKINLPKMKRTIEMTLDGSREIPVRFQDHDIATTIASAVESIKGQAQEENIVVEFQPAGSPVIFPHDPVQLERALTNLIKNGIEAAAGTRDDDKKNSVKIELKKLAGDTGVLIHIDDSGPGIDPRIENPFRPTRSTKVGGTGLGLYISSKIVRGHRGQIQIGSSPSLAGARFSMLIPRYQVEDLNPISEVH